MKRIISTALLLTFFNSISFAEDLNSRIVDKSLFKAVSNNKSLLEALGKNLKQTDYIYLKKALNAGFNRKLRIVASQQNLKLETDKNVVNLGYIEVSSDFDLRTTVNNHWISLNGDQSAEELGSKLRKLLPSNYSRHFSFESEAFAGSLSDWLSGVVSSIELARAERISCEGLYYAYQGCENPAEGYKYAVYAFEHRSVAAPKDLTPSQMSVVKAAAATIADRLGTKQLKETTCPEYEQRFRTCAKSLLKNGVAGFPDSIFTIPAKDYLGIHSSDQPTLHDRSNSTVK